MQTGLGRLGDYYFESEHPHGSRQTEICAFVKNRMRDYCILIGSEGLKDNILKNRPPLTFDEADAEMIATILDEVLTELA